MEEKTIQAMDKFGLLGKSIDYSFSKQYFTQKFEKENINAQYLNFDLADLTDFAAIVNQPHLKGLNVTIPYKEKIIPFLDELSPEADKIGAVNTISIEGKRLIGYNTDCFGFMKSLFPLMEKQHTHALILGSGGASKAVAYALHSLGIEYQIVSRNPTGDQLAYTDLSEEIMHTHQLIVNCTPLGTQPNTSEYPAIPYAQLSRTHLLYDLVYNPPLTTFLAFGKDQGAKLFNGQKMLEYQAERAWEIWNKS